MKPNKVFSAFLLLNSVFLVIFTIVRISGPVSKAINYIFIEICLMQVFLSLYHVYVFTRNTKKGKKN